MADGARRPTTAAAALPAPVWRSEKEFVLDTNKAVLLPAARDPASGTLCLPAGHYWKAVRVPTHDD